MDLVALGGVGLLVLIGVGVALVALIVILILIRAWYRVARADEALVIVGKKQRSTAGGESSSITVIPGGGAIVNPLTQRAEMISLRARQIKMGTVAHTSNGVTGNASGVALVTNGSTPDPQSVRRAAARVAGGGAAMAQGPTNTDGHPR